MPSQTMKVIRQTTNVGPMNLNNSEVVFADLLNDQLVGKDVRLSWDDAPIEPLLWSTYPNYALVDKINEIIAVINNNPTTTWRNTQVKPLQLGEQYQIVDKINELVDMINGSKDTQGPSDCDSSIWLGGNWYPYKPGHVWRNDRWEKI